MNLGVACMLELPLGIHGLFVLVRLMLMVDCIIE